MEKILNKREQIIERLAEMYSKDEKYNVREDILKQKSIIAVDIMNELVAIKQRGLDKKRFDAIVKKNTDKAGFTWTQKIWVENLENDKLKEMLDKLWEIDSINSESLWDIEYYGYIVKLIFSIYLEAVDVLDDSSKYTVYLCYLYEKLLSVDEEL